MNFVVDAHLPRQLAHRLRAMGHDAIHTLDLPDGNRTTDSALCDLAAREQRVVVTKDADFVQSFLLARRPPKLLLVSTGNITNRELDALMMRSLPAIVMALQSVDFVELSLTAIIIRG